MSDPELTALILRTVRSLEPDADRTAILTALGKTQHKVTLEGLLAAIGGLVVAGELATRTRTLAASKGGKQAVYYFAVRR